MKKILLVFLFVCMGAYAQDDVAKLMIRIENNSSVAPLYLSSEKLNKTITANSNGVGVYTAMFAVETDYYSFSVGQEKIWMFLKNGFDLIITMDEKIPSGTLKFKGTGEKENNLIVQLKLNRAAAVKKLGGLVNEPSRIVVAKEHARFINEHLDWLEAALSDPEIDENFRAEQMKAVVRERKQMIDMVGSAIKAEEMKNSPSPVFAYENFKGGTTKLDDFKGKYLYIDVWATWCMPCLWELPHMQDIEKEYQGKNIEFVSISIDELNRHEEWKKMVTDKSLGGVQLRADKGFKSEFVTAYGIEVSGVLRFIIIDPNGKVVDADAPMPSNPKLQEQLNGLLK